LTTAGVLRYARTMPRPPPSPESPEYDVWLVDYTAWMLTTSMLLHALVSREVRMEQHRRWRAERCNGLAMYTDELDRHFADLVADLLQERIDRR